MCELFGITIEELGNKDPAEIIIVDIRKKE